MESIDTLTVRRWLEATEAGLAKLEKERAELDARRAELSRTAKLLHELLGDQSDSKRVEPAGKDEPNDFRTTLLQLLRDSGGPMHLSEIRNALERRGMAVPGRGTDANIIAHLVRVAGISRVGRGTYQFGSAPQLAPSPAKKKAKRRRRRRTKNAA